MLRHRLILSVAAGLCLALPAGASEICSFTDWDWNTGTGAAENFREEVISRSQLTPAQNHADLPCTICREDQSEITLPGGETALVCAAIAPNVQRAIDAAIADGFPINTITGYRVGKTKGPVDTRGYRTQYSRHSFGLAIDFNADQNGLYDRCVTFSSGCRLRRGGVWRPGTPGAITPRSPIYFYMREAGFKWGGELRGRQKDFMHFSLTGD